MSYSAVPTRRRVLALLASGGVVCLAQKDRGTRSIRGVVTDSRSAPIRGASVRLKNLQTLQIRSVVTAQDGSYRFSNVALNAEYEISAGYAGHWSTVKSIRWYDSNADMEVNLVIEAVGPSRD